MPALVLAAWAAACSDAAMAPLTGPENRAPVASGEIPARTMAVGQGAVLDLSLYFSDPDGDPLAYTASTSNPGVSVSMSGSTVTAVAAVPGGAALTVTARDPGGLEASRTLAMRVADNRPPEVTRLSITIGTLRPGGMTQLRLRPWFSDPDGDALAYSAVSSDAEVATVSVTGQALTIRGVAGGEAEVTVTARDPGGLEASRTETVVVVGNRRPEVTRLQVDLATLEPGSSSHLTLGQLFSDPDGDALEYSATSSDPGVATVSLAGYVLWFQGVSGGTAEVTVTARDPGGLEVSRTETVVVVGNQPPEVSRLPITIGTLRPGGTTQVSLGQWFSDPDGDTLKYSAVSPNPDVATVSVSGQVLEIRGVGAGRAQVTVTARDPGLLETSRTVTVTVVGPNRAPVVNHNYQVTIDTLRPSQMAFSVVRRWFRDPDGDTLRYGAATSNWRVARVNIFFGRVIIHAARPGTAQVTVTARDPGGLTVTRTVTVTVRR